MAPAAAAMGNPTRHRELLRRSADDGGMPLFSGIAEVIECQPPTVEPTARGK
jgi:hypothetical protein